MIYLGVSTAPLIKIYLQSCVINIHLKRVNLMITNIDCCYLHIVRKNSNIIYMSILQAINTNYDIH